jgi:cation diffusion facilitator family transporter
MSSRILPRRRRVTEKSTQETSMADIGNQAKVFHEGNPAGERKTRRVVMLTAAMMVVEIAAGLSFNSMALLADGIHMSSHATALGLSVLAYVFARRFAHNPRFAFGTWKIEVLGGYTSAVLLVVVAAFMVYESVLRIARPVAIDFNDAIAVACVGLLVNLVCAWWLSDDHHHEHLHGDGRDHHGHHHHDLNLRSAYLHVVADAATSVLAIVALFSGKLWGASWLDPVMGIVGAVLVSVWAYGLLRDTSRVLVDAEMNAPIVDEIVEVIKDAPAPVDIADLRVWRIAKGKYACTLRLVTAHAITSGDVRQWLSVHDELHHVTVEVNAPERLLRNTATSDAR